MRHSLPHIPAISSTERLQHRDQHSDAALLARPASGGQLDQRPAATTSSGRPGSRACRLHLHQSGGARPAAHGDRHQRAEHRRSRSEQVSGGSEVVSTSQTHTTQVLSCFKLKTCPKIEKYCIFINKVLYPKNQSVHSRSALIRGGLGPVRGWSEPSFQVRGRSGRVGGGSEPTQVRDSAGEIWTGAERTELGTAADSYTATFAKWYIITLIRTVAGSTRSKQLGHWFTR